VADDDIDSSPTFELIVEGEETEEVELESRSSVTTATSGDESEAVTAFANKRVKIKDSNAADVESVSGCTTTMMFVTGLNSHFSFCCLNDVVCNRGRVRQCLYYGPIATVPRQEPLEVKTRWKAPGDGG